MVFPRHTAFLRFFFLLYISACAALYSVAGFAAPGDENWESMGGVPGVSGAVNAILKDGADVYVGGYFSVAGNVSVSNLAKWDGSAWSSVGDANPDGTIWNGKIESLAQDSQGNLYVAGAFTEIGGISANGIAMWNGSSWNAMSGGIAGDVYAHVRAVVVDSNDDVYVAGLFDSAGGVNASNVAMWNGSSWSNLSYGLSHMVYTLYIDDADQLYAGGEFVYSGPGSANRIAMWDGASWSTLGGGVSTVDSAVMDIAEDSLGNIYISGDFTDAGGVAVNQLAMWDGVNWSGFGFVSHTNPSPYISGIAVDANDNLYVGGEFNTIGGSGSNNVAMWDGASWNPLTTGLVYDGFSFNSVNTVVSDGDDVYIGGEFRAAGDIPVGSIAKWDGAAWSGLFNDSTAFNEKVSALAVDSVGNIYAGGHFYGVDGLKATRVAMWDGVNWTSVGDGVGIASSTWRYVNDLVVDANDNLYVAGYFSQAGGVSTGSIAKWDGVQWVALGTGLAGEVNALAIDSQGNLYVGGDFNKGGGMENIAMWDGANWQALGTGIADECPDLCAEVHSLAIDSNDNLYVGGVFGNAGGITSISNVAMWDGANWSALSSGVNSCPFGDCPVYALAVDDADNLYAGGDFSQIGGISAGRAKWDGATWVGLGGGSGSNSTRTLASDGTFLYAGGWWVSGIQRWDGAAWEVLGSGTSSDVEDLLIVDAEDRLYVGGFFREAGQTVSAYSVMWNMVDTDGDGTRDSLDDDDDNDTLLDSVDNCRTIINPDQLNNDGDAYGDVCDDDDDNDGINDIDDVFPFDPTEWVDFDNDGTGDNADLDDDNDGVDDVSDAFPYDNTEWLDTDGDGTGNNADPDDDNDGVADGSDVFPLDASEWLDFDNDGIGDNADPDDDNDGVADGSDLFPFDGSEWADNDADGTGDNADPDDDNDGIEDGSDAFPFDDGEWADNDSDGIGDNADVDDDNDDVRDENDWFPFDGTEWADNDGDGIGDEADTDDDNDGVADDVDNCPWDANADQLDNDRDGYIDACEDEDDDNDTLPDVFENDFGRDPLVPDYLVSTGWNTSCGKDDSATNGQGVQCWGVNSTTLNNNMPTFTRLTQIVNGSQHACAIDDGSVVCWGSNFDGRSTPPAMTNVTHISAFKNHNCAVHDAGVSCWGKDTVGQTVPGAMNNPQMVAVGDTHSCALDENGGVTSVVCWGSDDFGESTVPPLSNPIFVAAGDEHNCAIDDSGVVCWGSNGTGRSNPPALTNPTRLALGGAHSCAIDDGDVVCWGDDAAGQATPPTVTNPVDINLGYQHSCALSEEGVQCWGSDANSQSDTTALSFDSDNDGIQNINDTDYDNDGVLNAPDKFPYDASESADSDQDGVGNNADQCDSTGTLNHDFDGDGCDDIVEDADDDNDGMPDDWESTYGLNPLFDDSAEDPDGDGVSNQQEYINGTDPTVTDISSAVDDDYTNDGIAGWIWRGTSNGVEGVNRTWSADWNNASPGWVPPLRTFPPDWDAALDYDIETTGDFNGDGDADWLWRAQGNGDGRWKIWQIESGYRVGQNNPPVFDANHDWTVVGSGDTDNDGDDDIILNNAGTGEIMIWEMDTYTVSNTHSVGTAAGYTVVRLGDFDADGDTDLLLRVTGANTLRFWEIESNAFVQEIATPQTGAGFDTVCAGDFNGDGNDDVYLLAANGTSKWFEYSNFVRQQQVFGANQSAWIHLGCADYDGDGDEDMIWTATDGLGQNKVFVNESFNNAATYYFNRYGGTNAANPGYGFEVRGSGN